MLCYFLNFRVVISNVSRRLFLNARGGIILMSSYISDGFLITESVPNDLVDGTVLKLITNSRYEQTLGCDSLYNAFKLVKA